MTRVVRCAKKRFSLFMLILSLCKVLMITNTNVLVHMLCLSCVVDIGSRKYLKWLEDILLVNKCLRIVLRSAYASEQCLRIVMGTVSIVADWQVSKEHKSAWSTSEQFWEYFYSCIKSIEQQVNSSTSCPAD